MSTTTSLTAPELQIALRLGKLPPAPNSPFADLQPPSVIDPAVVNALRGKKVLNGDGRLMREWHQALAVLASPTHRVSVYLASADAYFDVQFYATSTGLVGYSALEDGANITFPGTPGDIETAAGEWLKWAEMPAVTPFHATLAPDEVTPLAAIVDAFREENLRALLDRRLALPGRFSREQLVYEIEQGKQGDPRWLAGLLAKHAPSNFQPQPDRLNGGVGSLVKRGLLKFEGDLVAVGRDMLPVCMGMSNTVPYAFFRIDLPNGITSSLLVTTGLKSYWIFEFGPDARNQQTCRLHSLGGTELRSLVGARLGLLPKAPAPAASWTETVQLPPAAVQAMPPRPTAPPPRPPEPPRQRPPAAAPPLPPLKSPAPAPPPRVVPAPPKAAPTVCPACGKALKPGRAFCGGCGAKVGA